MLTSEQKAALGIALNEATLLGVEVDPSNCRAAATFAVFSLPANDGPLPADARVQFLFAGVGRVVSSLRPGNWNDAAVQAQPHGIKELLSVVQSFGGLPIYGWEFFDQADRDLKQCGERLSLDWCGERLSLDWCGECGSTTHSISLFQEGGDRHLDLILWFESLRIFNAAGSELSLEEFTAAGKRWWDAFYKRDPRTQNSGMVPLA